MTWQKITHRTKRQKKLQTAWEAMKILQMQKMVCPVKTKLQTEHQTAEMKQRIAKVINEKSSSVSMGFYIFQA
ncbi:MAG: hypothetical protein UE970_09515 [Catenibacillus sp.]|nr:hypothetical protein [Catenibacillus sp.]